MTLGMQSRMREGDMLGVVEKGRVQLEEEENRNWIIGRLPLWFQSYVFSYLFLPNIDLNKVVNRSNTDSSSPRRAQTWIRLVARSKDQGTASNADAE